MHRALRFSGCLLIWLAACDKPVPSEIVEPRLGEAKPNAGFGDGAVIRDELDGGVDGDAGDFAPVDVEARFSKANLLTSVATCAVDRLERLRDAAAELRDVSARWAKDRSEANALAARAAFRAALQRLQRAEALKVGPAARSSSIGGQNLGDKLYTPFPSLDRCAIDRQLAQGKYADTDIASAPARQRGLSAFEYLAYYVGADNGCQAGVDINADGSWAALGAEELAQRRADFAAAIARDVWSVTSEILDAWSQRGGNFYGELTRPGGKLFRDEQTALNTVSNAMFYVELEVKDVKLGRILNRNGTTCKATTCPEALEAPLSEQSGPNIASNLSSFRDVFQGCGPDNRGLGFDDWLEAVGASQTSDNMLAALDQAEQEVAGLSKLEQALSSDTASVMKAYDAVKQLTDRLKGELTTVLGLEPPAGLEGDND